MLDSLTSTGKIIEQVPLKGLDLTPTIVGPKNMSPFQNTITYPKLPPKTKTKYETWGKYFVLEVWLFSFIYRVTSYLFYNLFGLKECREHSTKWPATHRSTYAIPHQLMVMTAPTSSHTGSNLLISTHNKAGTDFFKKNN